MGVTNFLNILVPIVKDDKSSGRTRECYRTCTVMYRVVYYSVHLLRRMARTVSVINL